MKEQTPAVPVSADGEVHGHFSAYPGSTLGSQLPMKDMLLGYGVALISLLSGAALVHITYQPDLRIPAPTSSKR